MQIPDFIGRKHLNLVSSAPIRKLANCLRQRKPQRTHEAPDDGLKQKEESDAFSTLDATDQPSSLSDDVQKRYCNAA